MSQAFPSTIEVALKQLALEGKLDQAGVASLVGADRRLIVYGSLVPGGSNHHVVAPLKGNWRAGWITGRLVEQGWGASMGYPALQWSLQGERVRAHLLESPKLVDQWGALDDFEGSEYQRILIPFFEDERSWVIGQVYVARGSVAG